MIFDESVYKNIFSALQEAEEANKIDEVPIGAVVVYQNKIIGKGFNQVESLHDSTAHAEMLALTAAQNYLGNKFLNDCDLYVTLEPCLMCTGAILLARIRNLYFGAFEPKTGACGSIYNIPEENKLKNKINVYSGIHETEVKYLIQKFFKSKRNS